MGGSARGALGGGRLKPPVAVHHPGAQTHEVAVEPGEPVVQRVELPEHVISGQLLDARVLGVGVVREQVGEGLSELVQATERRGWGRGQRSLPRGDDRLSS